MKRRRSPIRAAAAGATHGAPADPGPRTGPSRLSTLAVPALLVVLVAIVYARVATHDFVSFDDNLYVTGNPRVRDGLSASGLLWAFRSFHAANWHPLTWISHMLDVELFGLNAGAHHLVNVLFHAVNTVFLFFLLRRMTGDRLRSALVAALFAVHPLHVESVAWISERKDVLSTLLLLATIRSYLYLLESPGVARYLLLLLSFAAGLMAKPMLVTLPFLLLLLDVWPLRRWDAPLPFRSGVARTGPPWHAAARILEKLPLFALSALSCVIAWLAQARAGAMGARESFPLALRLGNAVVSYAKYLGKTVWPSNLSVFYPFPMDTLAARDVVVSGAVLALLTALAVAVRRKQPWAPVGWFWYLVSLVPVSGVVQVGEQAMADRYMYIPSIGLFLAVVWGIPESLPRWKSRPAVLGIAAGCALAALAALSWQQAGYWRDSGTLFTRAKEATRSNWVAQRELGVFHNNVGLERLKEGRTADAVAHFREAADNKPLDLAICLNLGVALAVDGNLEEAAGQFRRAVQIDPKSASAHYDLGKVVAMLGRGEEAAAHLREALRLQPGYPEARDLLASLERGGRR